MELDQATITQLFVALIALLSAISLWITSKTHDVAVTNKANIDTMNTAQTVQMVMANPTTTTPTTPTAPYRYMTDAAKSFETTGWSIDEKNSFLSQVAVNEAAGNVRYTVTIPGRGTAIVENGCVIDTNIAEK